MAALAPVNGVTALNATHAAPDRAGTPTGMPRGTLLALVAAVLAVHMALLQTAPGALTLGEPLSTRQFTTRTIALPTPPVAAAPPPRALPAPAAPRTPRPPPAAPNRPKPVSDTIFESNRPQVPAVSSDLATNSIANEPSEAATPTPAPPSAAAPAPEAVAAPAPPAPPVAVPAAMRLQYTVNGEARRLQYTANGELTFRHDGNAYEARAEISAFLFGARVQTSSGQLTPQGLAPTRFADKWRNELATHFDRQRGRISFSANTPEAPLLAGAQDRLSVLMQLGALLAGDPARYMPGTTISVQTAGPRDAETWQFNLGEPENLALPAGEIATVKLTRAPRREFDQRVEVWLAPSLGYLPARIRITQANGDFVDQQLRASGPP